MKYIYGVGDQSSLYDQHLLEYIRSHIAKQSPDRPRNLSKPLKAGDDVSQVGQSKFVDALLRGRRDGFFIECGANNGEEFSNSLFFELTRNWTGLLIEADPEYHRELLDKNRRAYVLQACLSPDQHPGTFNFLSAETVGGIEDKMVPSQLRSVKASTKHEVTVNCFPLNSIAAALNISHVDYFSLDVEGAELEILQTIDWTRLHIDVMTIEYVIYGGTKKEALARLKKLRKFFRDTGIYREVGKVPNVSDADWGIDVVFSRV